MSVGGKVIEVIKQENSVYIDTIDKNEKCAIYVELDENSKHVEVEDVVWWQGEYAYWTTQDRESKIEVKLKRIGYSGVERPE